MVSWNNLKTRLAGFKPRQSLKRVLSLWFILFALVPLLLIVGYAMVLFNQKINDELSKRLIAFEKGIDIELIDVEEKLRLGGFRHANDIHLMNLIRGEEKTKLKLLTKNIIENYIVDRISYFYPDGVHFLSIRPQRVTQDPETILPEEFEKLPKALIHKIKTQRQIVKKTPHPDIGFAIECYTLMKLGSAVVGIVKETILINRTYSLGTKERTGLDLCLLDKDHNLLISTLPPREEQKFHYPKKDPRKVIDNLKLADDSYMLLAKALIDDDEQPVGYIAILVSRANARKTLMGILSIFFLLCAGITAIVVLFTKIASRTVLHPLDQLLSATRAIQRGQLDQTITIPKMKEIGQLVDAFNEMSRALLTMKNNLEDKVKELHQANREIRSTQVQLVHSSKMASLGQLVAGVAHELNNPISYTYSNLNHLKTYMEKIQKTMKAKDQQEFSKLKKELNIHFILRDIDGIIKSSLDGIKRTKDIVGNLRNFSRLDEAEIKEVDLHEGLKATLNLLKSALKDRIQVHKKLGKLPKISCYSSQINQVFMNILSNAVQAIEGKGDIWIETQAFKNEIHIRVQDSGEGIPEADLSRIFDPFFTTKKVGLGTGLGLSISYSIIQKHHGDIRVESEIGKGSTFTIILPEKGIRTVP